LNRREMAGLKSRTIALNAPGNILCLLASLVLVESGILLRSVRQFLDAPVFNMRSMLTSNA
jgi:hypothetical protein